MRQGIVISSVLHVGAIALTLLGVPDLWERPAPAESTVVVELVKVADVTTPQVEKKPDPKPEPLQEVKREEPVPEPPDPAPPPKPVVAEAPPPPPPPPPPEPAPEPVREPQPKPEAPEPEVAKVEAPKPMPKPKPPAPAKAEQAPEPKAPPEQPLAKPEPTKPDFDPSRLAALLDKRAEQASPPAKLAEEPKKQRVQVEPNPMEQVARRLGEQLTISEVDAIRAQIQRCWSVPAGARDAEDLAVQVKVYLRPDGSLARPPEIVDQRRMRMSGQEFFRAAAESALRAVRKCNPLRDLPRQKYDMWRELTLTFDPKEMVNG